MSDRFHRGSLPEPSLYQVFRSLGDAGETGVLHLERDGSLKTIHFQDGRIRFATTTRADERLGAEAVRQRLATWWQVQEAAKVLGAERRLGNVMVDQGILSGEEQARLVRDHLRHIVVEALSWREGTFRFERRPPESGESITLAWPVADCILEEARRSRDEGALRETLGNRNGYLRMARRPAPLPVELNRVEKRVLTAVNGERTAAEVARIAGAPEEAAIRTLAGLVRAGCLEAPARAVKVLAGAASGSQEPVAAKTRTAAPSPSGPSPAADREPGRYAMRALERSERFQPESRAWVLPRPIRVERAAILELADQLHRLDHYQLLGAQADDPPDRIREVFHERARRFHPDRRVEPGLGNLVDELARIYDALRIAYQTLENPESRADYDQHRERDHRATEKIRQAAMRSTEAYLHTATLLIRRGNLPDAIPVLHEAIRSSPECAVAHFRLAQCLAATSEDRRKARNHFERAAELEPQNARYQAALTSVRPRPGEPRRGLADRLARWLHLQGASD
jgi:tetratricopeptide (TPR) repeat protein